MPTIEPIFVSVADAAEALAITERHLRKLLDEQRIESRYEGRRRLVSVASLREYADGLSRFPTVTS